jgi:hypothetical protein
VSHGYKGPNVNARNALGVVLDKAHQCPRRGEHVGPRAAAGPTIQATWDGNGPVPFGWGSFQAHRTDPEETIWLPEPETQTKLARLTPGEQGQLVAARAQAEPHGAAPVAEAISKARRL